MTEQNAIVEAAYAAFTKTRAEQANRPGNSSVSGDEARQKAAIRDAIAAATPLIAADVLSKAAPLVKAAVETEATKMVDMSKRLGMPWTNENTANRAGMNNAALDAYNALTALAELHSGVEDPFGIDWYDLPKTGVL
jgi:hypothetical protein